VAGWRHGQSGPNTSGAIFSATFLRNSGFSPSSKISFEALPRIPCLAFEPVEIQYSALPRMTLAGIPYYTFAWNNVDWSAVLIVCFARDSLVSLGAVYSSKGASTVVFHRRTPYSIHVSRGTRQVAFNPMTSYREIIKLSKSLCHHTAPCLNGET